MLDRLLHEILETASAWERDVEQRRRITHVDPVADTRAFDAQELRTLADKLKDATMELTTDQFASLHKTSRQTVIRWIHRQKISARRTAQGWLIPGDTIPPRWKKGRRQARRA